MEKSFEKGYRNKYPEERPIKDRFRAWFLVKSESGTSEMNAMKLVIEPPDDILVIRADIVDLQFSDACDFDLIVPVEASRKENLQKFAQKIKETEGLSISNVVMASVSKHFPPAPFLSQGYISKEEAKLGIDNGVVPETLFETRKSPGDNPWG
jgi:hypothetical protein